MHTLLRRNNTNLVIQICFFLKMTLNILLGTDGAAKWFNSLILIIHRSTY